MQHGEQNDSSERTTGEFSGHIPREELHKLIQIAIKLGLPAHRDSLLLKNLADTLPQENSQRAQLLSDIVALNSIESLRDGTVPMLEWLRRAHVLTKERSEATLIRRLHRDLEQAHELSNGLSQSIEPRTKSENDVVAGDKQISKPPENVAPNYPDEITRQLSERLELIRLQKQEIKRLGGETTTIDMEILSLRRQLREGGRLRAGDSLNHGRYLLLDIIGKGGFGCVWKAFDKIVGKIVAVKVLHTVVSTDQIRLERFFRGARVMTLLQHESIVRVLQPKGEDGGYYYFVMDFIDGLNLQQAVHAEQMTQRFIIDILLQIGDALGSSHTLGIIHRDIKPANILLDHRRKPHITDFDLAWAADTTGGTREGALGTFKYVAPEILDNPSKVTARSDVYGLGMTAVFCFRGKELPATAIRNSEEIINELNCDARIKSVLRQSVDWDPQNRFADANEFHVALRRACEPATTRLRLIMFLANQKQLIKAGSVIGIGTLLLVGILALKRYIVHSEVKRDRGGGANETPIPSSLLATSPDLKVSSDIQDAEDHDGTATINMPDAAVYPVPTISGNAGGTGTPGSAAKKHRPEYDR